ncbi:DUF2813 domain-containing protein [Photobacterium kishitanii]|uniref:DUF2813 domain-containing protein n=1 Tax=Photobacterium kishitanii TaxID=318456 RepID=UPI0007F8EDA5|nr:DUF2813 domain-containing protein [Photobacterium kishitanii]OBU30897.1 ATP-dependent endonuclease [Photobacterium kishitanii]PSW47654.1 ATP-dependent endonuclease [Photobacterium kishitanii]
MHLERIEIAGFRGIKRLSLSFNELTVLIGENAWGKSSLLDALSLTLCPSAEFYEMKFSDFHIDHAMGHERASSLQIVLRWHEDYQGEYRARRYRAFDPFWVEQNNLKHLYIQIDSHIENDKIITHRHFLHADGHIIKHPDTDKFLRQLMVLHPIVRIRDARHLEYDNNTPATTYNTSTMPPAKNRESDRIQRRLDNTCRRLMTQPGHVSAAEIKSSINTLRSLVDHYFAFTPHKRSKVQPHSYFPLQNQHDDQCLNPFDQLVQPKMTKQAKLILMGLLNAYIRARGPVDLKRISRPIMILEDPEGRLHPIMLHQAWAFIQNMPMQKLLTTNSPELLSVVPLTAIKRLQRTPQRTVVHSINNGELNKDDIRKVTFHVRMHRPSAFYARVWLLVEGETEVWLFNEMAQLTGYNLAAEGIHVIEFAQSGLKPLIKLARLLGIEWHLVADGDPAGRKYADKVRSLLNIDSERERLTVLPAKDIEHFLFKKGYEPLFRQLANISENDQMPIRKIIYRALKKHAKPDIALAIVKYTQESESDKMPLLIRWVLKRVIIMARGIT